MTNPGRYVDRNFPDFGVTVTVPTTVTVTFTRVDPDPKYDRTQPNFAFRRLIGNLKFEEGGRTEFAFDPPVRLRALIPSELRPLRNSLKLAWWDGSAWQPLRVVAGEDPASLFVEITTITDPPVSWGT